MFAPDPQLSRTDVLRAFRHNEIFLFLGALFMSVGLLAGFYSFFRRRFDQLLLWFSLFAFLYGVRLWMLNQLIVTLGVHAPLFMRILVAIDYLVPIPAFLFFRAVDLLGRIGRILADIVTPSLLALAVLTLAFGPHRWFHTVNNTIFIVALSILVVTILRAKDSAPDINLMRRGLLVFIAFALVVNITGLLEHFVGLPRFFNIEPFGFLFLLSCLGIVAGRRTLAQEQQLSDIQKELEIARNIQLSILPPRFPASASFQIAVRYLPMTSVAGDFYDFILTGDHEAGLLIADVSGHGVPAALIASMVKLAATAQRAQAAHPDALLGSMNNALLGNTQSQFVTAAYVYLNVPARELRYAAAAHPPMLLLRDGEVVEIVENGLMLAAFDFATYTATTRALEPGDRLVLYTDGVVEAIDAANEEFGRDRLHALLRETAHLSHSEAADHILDSVRSWSAMQTDDLTLMLCDVARSSKHAPAAQVHTS